MVKKGNHYLTHQDSQLFENCIWLNTNEAAEYLRTTPAQIRNWVYQGKVRFFKLFGRLRFKRADLDSLIFNKGESNGYI